MQASLVRAVALVGVALASLATNAARNEDVFASTGQPAPCGVAYMACAADKHLKQSTSARYRAAGEQCYGNLQTALGKEDELNAALPQLVELTGQARTDFNHNTVQPAIKARGDAMAEFNQCTAQAMQDMRPQDYPKSRTLLSGGSTADGTEQIVDDLERMVAGAGDNAMFNGDRFLQGVLDWANETATFFAQEPGKPLEQIITGTGTLVFEAVPAYLMNNNAENHAQLYAAAEKAIGDFQEDPVYHIGHAAPNAIPLGALSRAKALASLRQTTGALKRLSRRKSLPGGLEPEVRNQIAKRPMRRPPTGDDGAGPPPGTDSFPLDRPPSVDSPMDQFPLNPHQGCPNCLTVQIAKDLREYHQQPFQAASGNLGTLENQRSLLRELYGGTNAKDPYHGRDGLQKMASGMVVPSSKTKIERALETAATRERFHDVNGNPIEPAPRGFAYVEYTNGDGHAFDAKWNQELRRTVFTDDSQNLIPESELFDDARAIWFYRQR